MAERPTAWKPGQSGNPRGRPPGQRALTEILRRAGNKTVPSGDGGRKVARKRILAEMAWSLATTGEAQFPDGSKLVLAPSDWWQVVKFIYQHIDGAPKQDIDLTSGGEQINITIKTDKEQSDETL